MNSTEKVLLILKAFVPNNPPRGVHELCNELNMKPATVSRIFGILKEHGFVEQNEDRKYQLGEAVTTLGQARSESQTDKLIAIVKPHLEQINRILNENIQLELFLDNNVKIAAVVPGNKTVRVHTTARPGVWVGVNATAGAKAIIAFLSPERLKDIFKVHAELQKYQPSTITDWNELKQKLSQIRETGIAYDFSEYVEDVCAVATPIFNNSNEVIGAVTVAVPFLRDGIISEQKTIDLIKETAQKITIALRDLSP